MDHLNSDSQQHLAGRPLDRWGVYVTSNTSVVVRSTWMIVAIYFHSNTGGCRGCVQSQAASLNDSIDFLDNIHP